MNLKAWISKKIYKNRWKLKSCPRCLKGDLYSFYGENYSCLQCGWVDYNNKFNNGGTNNAG